MITENIQLTGAQIATLRELTEEFMDGVRTGEISVNDKNEEITHLTEILEALDAPTRRAVALDSDF